ncbi:MAG TPA: universal stress protein [Streptosporangiaceae bacterium]|nr:universal stress protein [Streptosporangiaceae bacterium]
MSGIIVGVDESAHSRNALRWAMHEAVLRQVPLTVMTVRPSPARPATMAFWGLHTYSADDQDLVRTAVQKAVDKVAGEIGGTQPEVTVSVTAGNPAEELVNASRDADMLVVGSRGSGGFGRLMMGSVSSQVSHHAACAVVIIPEHRAH